jgi:hypothetical protein
LQRIQGKQWVDDAIPKSVFLNKAARHRQCKSADYQSMTTQKKSLAEANKKVNFMDIWQSGMNC